MEYQGENNILAYLADIILKSNNNNNSGIKYSSIPFDIEKSRAGLKNLQEQGLIIVEKDYDSYLYEKVDEDPFPVHENKNKSIYTIPAGALIKIKDYKKLEKLAKNKTPVNPNLKILTKDKDGSFYVKDKKINITKGTDHYVILDLMYSRTNIDGIITKESAISFLNEKGIKVAGRKINESNINKKISNSVQALRFAKISGNRLKKELIQSVKEGKSIIGWKIEG